jgi:hypothetical protein
MAAPCGYEDSFTAGLLAARISVSIWGWQRAGEEQELGRLGGAAVEDHLVPGAGFLSRAALGVLDADAALSKRSRAAARTSRRRFGRESAGRR